MSSNVENPLRVLVIDDQKAMRSIIRRLLNGAGIEDIAEAESGREGLAHLENPHTKFPDVIICDLHMHEMDGLEFCNSIRRSEKLRNNGVPILILTGDPDQFLHEVSQQVGAVSVLTKPVTAEELTQQIAKAVGYAFA